MTDAYRKIVGVVLPYTCPKKRDEGDQQDKSGVTMAAIDMIFHCSKLRALRVLGLPKADQETMTPELFPNTKFPSDHPYMLAELTLATGKKRVKMNSIETQTNEDMLTEMQKFKDQQLAYNPTLKMLCMMKKFYEDAEHKKFLTQNEILPNADALIKWRRITL